MKGIVSNRTPANFEPNHLTRILEENTRSGRSLLDLTISNPTSVGLKYPEAEIRELFSRALSCRYDPNPRGLLSARQAINPRWNPEHLWLTSSTSEAYGFLFKLLAEPGDEVLVPTPSYPLFEALCVLEGVKPVSYPLVCDRNWAWAIDMNALASRVTAKTRAIILVHPNNPTGSFVKGQEFDVLNELAQEFSLPIISDEVFGSYPLQDSVNRLTALEGMPSALTFTLGGLSKRFGLPQLKLSWIYASGPASALERIAPRLDWICDTYLSVSGPVQQALPEIMRVGEPISKRIIERIRGNDQILRRRLSGASRVTYVPGEGGWSAILKLPEGMTDEALAQDLLAEHAVLVQPGFYYDLPFEAVVVSLLTPPAELEKGIDILQV